MIWNIVRIVFALAFVVIAYWIYREPDLPVPVPVPKQEKNTDFHATYRIDENTTVMVYQKNYQLIFGLSYEF